MDTSQRAPARIICPISMLNYPEAPGVYCDPARCSAWRPDDGADPAADAPPRGRCAVIDPEVPGAGWGLPYKMTA